MLLSEGLVNENSSGYSFFFIYRLRICFMLLLLRKLLQNLTYSETYACFTLRFPGKTVVFLSGAVPQNSKLIFVL